MRSTFSKIKSKAVPGLVAAMSSLALAVPAYAAKVTIVEDLNPKDVVGELLDFLLTMGQLIGGGFIIYAVITFAISISQENPDQQARAIKCVVAGAVLVGIKIVLQTIGVIA